MSQDTNIQDVVTRIATEFKALRILISGSGTGGVGGLDTSATDLVAAINEVLDAVGTGGSVTLDSLTDVVITSAATGDIIRYNGTNWVDVDGTTLYQPVDSDLTSIAALTTTSYGRALLELANQAALLTAVGAATATASGVVELATTAETTTGTDTVRAVTPAGVQAAIDALVASAPGALNTLDELAAALGDDANFASTVTTALSGKQALDTDLTAIAALTSAANKGLQSTGAGTWALYDLTAAGKALLDDADAAAQRGTLSVYSTTEIGSVTTDYVATFEAALT